MPWCVHESIHPDFFLDPNFLEENTEIEKPKLSFKALNIVGLIQFCFFEYNVTRQWSGVYSCFFSLMYKKVT